MQNANLVGTVEDTRIAIEASVVRLIVVVVIVQHGEAHPMLIARIPLDHDGVLALLLFVKGRLDPVVGRRGGVRRRIGLQQAQAVRTQAGSNHVVGIWRAWIGSGHTSRTGRSARVWVVNLGYSGKDVG